MHVHTVRTRFTFGDPVRFNTKHQRCSGTGTVFEIAFDGDGTLTYMLLVNGDLQPGIEEEAITLLSDEADTPAVV